MKQQEHLPVNWTDGMKINQSHFIAQDNANRYLAVQSAGALLNNTNYGLLPHSQQGNAAVKLFMSIDNQQQVQLRIQYCRAITRGGCYIHFEEDTSLHASTLSAPLLRTSVPLQELKAKSNSAYYVVITANPYQRIPYGTADMAEVPARLPFTAPSLQLSLLAAEDAGMNTIGLYQLPVGKIMVEDQKVFLDDEYIPPCAAMNSHADLMELYANMEQFYNKMESCSVQIVQKIIQKNQVNEMALILQRLSENVMLFVSSQLTDVRLSGSQQPVVYTISAITSLARLFKNTLDCYTGSGKEELMNYCAEWCNINQGELEKSIADLCNHTYNHLDLGESTRKAFRFAKTAASLFINLAKLDYIGKRRETGIFVNEKIVSYEPEVPVKTRRSFLAD